MTAQPSSDTILRGDAKAPFDIRATQPPATGEGVVDAATFRAIETDSLFNAVNHARTRIGQAVLHRSLVRPADSLPAVADKQAALKELEENADLCQGITRLVQRAAQREGDFYQLLYASFIGMLGTPANDLEAGGYGYEAYVRGTRFMLGLAEDAAALPAPRGAYLRQVLADIGRFSESRAGALMRGPVYRTEKTVVTKKEKGILTPAVKFTPTLFKPVALALLIVLGVVLLNVLPLLLDIVESILPALWLFLVPIALTYTPIVGSFDRDGCIYPLREIYRRSPEVQGALDALGRLDELLAFRAYAEAFGAPAVLPTLLDGAAHRMVLAGARNPVLGKSNPHYVPNDIALDGNNLAFITGPNSGGKTAFCKTVAQIQLLAQAGGYVPAEAAQLTVADRIFYQIPDPGSLADGEGRFGSELKRTKAIFLASSSRSLVILDELSEGTTSQEKLEISANILEGFHKKGNNTLLITHNHELVDVFQDQQIGLARQVEFVHDDPTHRLIPGISRISHAHRIARKIGFAKEDIAEYLKQKGID